MLTEQITRLLSNHRYPNNSTMPFSLTQHQIIALLNLIQLENWSFWQE